MIITTRRDKDCTSRPSPNGNRLLQSCLSGGETWGWGRGGSVPINTQQLTAWKGGKQNWGTKKTDKNKSRGTTQRQVAGPTIFFVHSSQNWRWQNLKPRAKETQTQPIGRTNKRRKGTKKNREHEQSSNKNKYRRTRRNKTEVEEKFWPATTPSYIFVIVQTSVSLVSGGTTFSPLRTDEHEGEQGSKRRENITQQGEQKRGIAPTALNLVFTFRSSVFRSSRSLASIGEGKLCFWRGVLKKGLKIRLVICVFLSSGFVRPSLSL